MNIHKKMIVAGIVTCFVGAITAGQAFDYGRADRKGNLFNTAGSTNAFKYFASTVLNNKFVEKLHKDGAIDRLRTSFAWYGESAIFEEVIVNEQDQVVRINNPSYQRSFARVALYLAADRAVSPVIDVWSNTSLVKATVDKVSPETQKFTGNMVRVVSASALAKVAEAAYDNQVIGKPYEQSAQEFAANAGLHVASEVVHRYVIKTIAKEVITPEVNIFGMTLEVEPIINFTSGVMVPLLIIEAMKMAANTQ